MQVDKDTSERENKRIREYENKNLRYAQNLVFSLRSKIRKRNLSTYQLINLLTNTYGGGKND